MLSREDVDESFFKAIPPENEGIDVIYPVRVLAPSRFGGSETPSINPSWLCSVPSCVVIASFGPNS